MYYAWIMTLTTMLFGAGNTLAAGADLNAAPKEGMSALGWIFALIVLVLILRWISKTDKKGTGADQ